MTAEDTLITRRDGRTMGFTDHDRNIVFDGTTFEAATGFTLENEHLRAVIRRDGHVTSLRDKHTGREALAQLCEAYWYPVYGFIRGSGHSAENARDLAQGFFVSLLSGAFFARADPDRGAFRAFAIFDKPDPLDGPFFEETIYVTPSRVNAGIQRQIEPLRQPIETFRRGAARIEQGLHLSNTIFQRGVDAFHVGEEALEELPVPFLVDDTRIRRGRPVRDAARADERDALEAIGVTPTPGAALLSAGVAPAPPRRRDYSAAAETVAADLRRLEAALDAERDGFTDRDLLAQVRMLAQVRQAAGAAAMTTLSQKPYAPPCAGSSWPASPAARSPRRATASSSCGAPRCTITTACPTSSAPAPGCANRKTVCTGPRIISWSR